MQQFLCNFIITAVLYSSLSLAVQGQSVRAPSVERPAQEEGHKPEQFEKSIIAFEKEDQNSPPAKGGILFVGSSSIRLWPIKESFPHRKIIHRGFGGSNTTDLNFYFDRIVLPYEPKVIVYYEGDNDIGQKVSPVKVIENTQHFVDRVHKIWPETVILYLPIKPSIKRWAKWEQMQEVNQSMREIAAKDSKFIFLDTISPLLTNGNPDAANYKEDGLHLNEKGYQLWTPVVEAELVKLFPMKQE